MPQTITRLNPSTLPDPSEMGYSQISIVEPGRMAYVSGQVASRQGDEALPEDLAAQSRLAAANARAALDALGATPADVAMLRCYVVGLTSETLEQVFPPVLEMLDGARPSVTGIGVETLAADTLKVELELIVRLPD
ncbi:Enamine deaminase RidA, house cleaning of reactive enamine intermediates, YjgF/YER057c/UK114 family [Albimonas donghaensis]|uniref:Enamine deaminase RidA, house cleaning of reactive enamine intermediates, YjgF/YER057c/UK114 family n=1 Tax=Albimonas donghaensis TaxID=356660 RepID=A0A1H3FBM3_9RHOB|nr:RidA family protein [Albimonas donghaensis]SDX88285.1 Enamine deaminase RidA, house cleaning of reactive enamine intermediates, YjgF/YER057c/UK114 family [Albimonas donghaensis]